MKLDWLNESNAAVPRGEDCGFKAFSDSVDAIVMGRKTYETVLSFGEWPYEGKSIVVLSRNRDLFSAQCAEYCHPFIGRATRSSRKAHKRRSRACVCRWRNLQFKRFFADGLVDEITVTTIPIILGDGIPLFGSLEKSINLDPPAYDCFSTLDLYRRNTW